MKFNNLLPALMIAGTLTFGMTSCKSTSDADIKTKVEASVVANPDVKVEVKDGVVTLSGTVSSEANKAAAEAAAKASMEKGIKSVVNTIVVNEPVAPVVVTTATDALTMGVADATKDFPTVTTRVNNGVIYVTGTLEKAKVQTLKMALDNLKPKKVDMTGVTVK